ncbi:MAG: amidohydrolase family protein [Burkholderiaceae bacterium]|nr:amidohydrolase family protein [Burkholderiaceae bacterium]
MHDLLIRGARLIDGSGAPSYHGDLAVRDGKIAAIGSSLKVEARRVIDADGLALMPGIIDSHTHFDAQITWDPYVRPSPGLGVTSAVIGNCGFAIAPCKPEDRERTMRNLTQVEGMSLDVLRSGIRWEFESFSEYLQLLERQGSVVNLAAYVGHSSVRTYVMGEAATQREATQQEIEQMAALVRDAMQVGAVGLASSTSPAHNGEAGTPMPSRLAHDNEHLALIRAMACQGGGVYMVTKGGQMPISLLEEMSVQSKRPVMIAALLHNSTNGGAVFKDLDAIEAANHRGNPLIGQVSCCPLTMDFTLASPYPVEGLPSWKPALGLAHAALLKVLADQSFRKAVKAELESPAVFRLFNGEWDKVHIVEVAKASNAHLEQCSLATMATQSHRHPLDVMLDLALEEDLKTVFTAQLLNSDEMQVARMLNHPHSLVSLSDAGAHLTFFNDAGFGLHLLGHWARDLSVMSLEQAAYKLTAQSAAIFGMSSRGLLRESFAADLLLFDPQCVGRGPKRRVHDLPGGASRLHTDALGVHGVWVNGHQVADSQGIIEGAKLAGHLMRNFDAQAVFNMR